MNIVDRIYENTIEFTKSVPKDVRKKIGQFFTYPSVASYMGSLLDYGNEHIDILDAGAGSGILSGALIEKVLENPKIQSVFLCMYENNDAILPILNKNVGYISEVLKEKGIKFTYKIDAENFIWKNIAFWRDELGASSKLYDVIISNPPYKKISKDDLESKYMPEVVHGQPNIYFLFMAMSAKLLKQNGQMIYITPRSFTSGAYFRRFREWLFKNVSLTNVHIFVSRDNVFELDKILQETIITKYVKSNVQQNEVLVSETPDMSSFNDIASLTVPYSVIVDNSDKNYFIRIPTNQDEVELLKMMHNWNNTLLSLGYKLKTGPIVDFRATEYLVAEPSDNTVPTFWASNYNNYHITHPVFKKEEDYQYIIDSDDSKSLLLKNINYIFVKRFTSKEEKRRIQPVLYFANDFNTDKIGVENHLNYVAKDNGMLTDEELYGLFTILNTTYVDRYYRILNGSTQVNANEINSMPMPDLKTIIKIGKEAKKQSVLTVEICDDIVKNAFDTDVLRKVI